MVPDQQVTVMAPGVGMVHDSAVGPTWRGRDQGPGLAVGEDSPVFQGQQMHLVGAHSYLFFVRLAHTILEPRLILVDDLTKKGVSDVASKNRRQKEWDRILGLMQTLGKKPNLVPLGPLRSLQQVLVVWAAGALRVSFPLAFD
jgi:hypothetical protein